MYKFYCVFLYLLQKDEQHFMLVVYKESIQDYIL